MNVNGQIDATLAFRSTMGIGMDNRRQARLCYSRSCTECGVFLTAAACRGVGE